MRPSEMSSSQFADVFGDVYEHSPWIANRTVARGIDTHADNAKGLAAAMAEVVNSAAASEQLALLRAHPDLAGKLALAGDMTTSSLSEQASAGLDQCTAEELQKFQQLNSEYTKKFGFPFILAVRGLSRHEILEKFEQRVANSPEAEFADALQQVNKIAYLRLKELF